MKKSILNLRMPTILGLLLLLGGIAGGIFFISKNKLSGIKSGPSAIPNKINITNITDNQFSVSWITNEKTTGFIKYDSTPNIKTVVQDDRDQLSSETTDYFTHYVTIKNLESGKTYYFKIGSGNKLYDNDGKVFTVNTGSVLGSAGEAKIISGRVLSAVDSPAPNAVVYLTSGNTASYSSLTDKEGRFAIFLNKVRASDLSSYAVIDPETTILKINAESGSKDVSAITTAKNAFPIPDIIFGHAPYDFREGQYVKDEENDKLALTEVKQTEQMPTKTTKEPKSEITVEKPATPSAEPKIPSQFPLQPLSSPSTSVNVIINNPAVDGEEINTLKPEFKGTGPSFKVLTIKIESPVSQTSTTIVDKDGYWSYTPPDNLSSGAHTIYISYVDEEGSGKSISRSFTVLAAGKSDLPALTATPSAETTASPSPSPITRVSMPSTESGVPKTGIIIPTLSVLITGIILIFLGLIFI